MISDKKTLLLSPRSRSALVAMKFCLMATCKNRSCHASFSLAPPVGVLQALTMLLRFPKEVPCPQCGFSMWVKKGEVHTKRALGLAGSPC